MIKQTWNINSEEKLRILNLHESATKNLYLLKEQEQITPYSINFDDNTFESGQYNFNNSYSKIINDKVRELANYIKGKNLKDFKIKITPGESRVKNQPPFDKVGSLAQKRGEVLSDYLGKVLTPLLGFTPEIVISDPVIGQEPYNRETDNKDDPKYKKEQFVKASVELTTVNQTPTPTPTPIPNPDKGFVINVRGDEPGGLGAYYFPQTLEDWKKITYDPRLSGLFASADQRGSNYAGTTVNMNDDVFKKYWLSKAPEIEKILGPAYLRDPNRQTNNPNQFILKSNIKNKPI